MDATLFIDSYKLFALETATGGLFPSLIMAQAILESEWGESTLAADYNNFFGIKADSSWTGKSVNLQTREVIDNNDIYINDNFRVYDSPKQSFQDRADFLRLNARYSDVFKAVDVYSQAQLLQSAGYATDPNYANVLINVIGSYNLTELDKIQRIMKTIDYSIIVMLIIIFALTWYKIFKY